MAGVSDYRCGGGWTGIGNWNYHPPLSAGNTAGIGCAAVAGERHEQK